MWEAGHWAGPLVLIFCCVIPDEFWVLIKATEHISVSHVFNHISIIRFKPATTGTVST